MYDLVLCYNALRLDCLDSRLKKYQCISSYPLKIMQLAFNLSIKFGIIGKTIGIQILPTAWKALTLVKVVIALKVLPSETKI